MVLSLPGPTCPKLLKWRARLNALIFLRWRQVGNGVQTRTKSIHDHKAGTKGEFSRGAPAMNTGDT